MPAPFSTATSTHGDKTLDQWRGGRTSGDHRDGGSCPTDRWNVNIPGYTPVTHTPGDGPTDGRHRYDLMPTLPTLNPVSWANALMGAAYDHPSYSKKLLDDAAAEDGS